MAKTSHLGVVQGSVEKRGEAYIEYIERVSEMLTQQCTKSLSRVTSSAWQQAEALRGFA